MTNTRCQLMLHVIITIGAWLSIYLVLSLLVYKEEKLTISDFTETFSGMSMLIHVLVMYFGVMLPIICLDTLIMTLLVLTQIQFRLLGEELQNIFLSTNIQQSKKNLAKVVKFHEFLLRLVIITYIVKR
nr:unnamed protein product [Callosobruchus analis]